VLTFIGSAGARQFGIGMDDAEGRGPGGRIAAL